jgi:Cation efflux family
MNYYFAKTLSVGFDEAVWRTTEVLKHKGFGIITEIDVKESLRRARRARLAVRRRPGRAMADRGSETPALPVSVPEAERALLIREAFRLEYATLAWMLIEAAVAIGAGVAAHSITLLAFGIDSVIELASAVVLIWRLTVELQRGQTIAESAERAASRIGGALLFALSAYIVVAAGWSLWAREGQAFSWPGLLVSLAALPVMSVLARRKLRIADALGSRALRTDAAESITCGWLSFAVVTGLLAQLALGAWWIDPVTSLAIVGLLVREGREAWKADEEDD